MFYCFTLLNAKAEKVFDTEDARIQAYVVKQLTHALRDSDIVILQDRRDELSREEDAVFTFVQRLTLGLQTVRFIGKVKGDIHVSPLEAFYLYANDYYKRFSPLVENEIPNPCYYEPLFLGANMMTLAFMKHQPEPIKERVAIKGRFPNLESIAEDAKKMEGKKFLTKYNLSGVFSNKVYKLVEGCIFHIDYPEPVMAENETIRMNDKMNNQTPERVKAHLAELRKSSGFIHLSSREVSEIVFIAYLLEGDKGVAHYAAARKDVALLEPVEEMTFKTNIGKKLFEALKTEIRMPPKGNSNTNPPGAKKP